MEDSLPPHPTDPSIPVVRVEEFTRHTGFPFEHIHYADGSMVMVMSRKEFTFRGERHLPMALIEKLKPRKDDLAFQMALCEDMITKGDILPFPFERAAILLRREGRLEDELRICEYVADWLHRARKGAFGEVRPVGITSPTLLSLERRVEKIKQRIKRRDSQKPQAKD